MCSPNLSSPETTLYGEIFETNIHIIFFPPAAPDIIFIPYNYLVDADIRRTLGLNLRNVQPLPSWSDVLWR